MNRPRSESLLREVLPGVHHWTAMHPSIGMPVSSYYLESAGVLIDPKAPDDDLGELVGLGRQQQVVLTSGLHVRDAIGFANAFDCIVRAPGSAEARLAGKLDFVPYHHGEEVAPGVVGLEIGRLAPDEGALHLEQERAIVFADALNHYGDTPAFFPDYLLGEHPSAVKRALTEAFESLLTLEFDHLLFAHGDPIVRGGKSALRDFVVQQREGLTATREDTST